MLVPAILDLRFVCKIASDSFLNGAERRVEYGLLGDSNSRIVIFFQKSLENRVFLNMPLDFFRFHAVF